MELSLLLSELFLYEFALELSAEGIFAEIYRIVIENTFHAEIITFKDGALCLFVYQLHLVDGFLRDDQMAWYQD